MPHPILVTTAVTASALATALAVEHFVFRPWRQDNFPEGFVPGMRREWQGFKEDFRQGLHEMAGGSERWPHEAGRHGRPRADSEASRASGNAVKRDDDDEGWGLSNEVAMHEEEMKLVRRRQATDMGLVDAVVDGALHQDGPVESHEVEEEQHIIGTPPLSPSKRHQSVSNAMHSQAASVAESWDALSERRSQATSPFEQLAGTTANDGHNASFTGSASNDDEWERLSNSSTQEGSVVSFAKGSR